MNLARGSKLISLWAATLGIALLANAGVATGTLAGRVLDAHGKPVAGATVTLQASDSLHPHATHTDSNGHFEFARFATGQYDLRAESKGEFSKWVRRVSLRSHKIANVILRLPPAADESIVVKP
jgi:hypothetical protein